MLNLLRKDFIALRGALWILAVYIVVFSWAFIPQMEWSMYIVGIYTAFGSTVLITMIDITNHNHNFLVTLPVSRKQIVQAKFLSSILTALCGVLVSYGIHKLINLNYPELNKPNHSPLDILISMGIVLVLVSVYMPLFYALSKKGAMIINIIFLVCLVILAQPAAFIFKVVGKEGLITAPVIIGISTAVIGMFFLSYMVTIRLFERKDL
ncbi:ABC-2 transporter permease [Paenibacillus sp. FSL R7-0652]|uniref:ABC-2 transporter permease n=1 Tax=Paenibacillus sp. AN1007 TaxID=3151385 RepID=A0AAU8N7E6_9BACL